MEAFVRYELLIWFSPPKISLRLHGRELDYKFQRAQPLDFLSYFSLSHARDSDSYVFLDLTTEKRMNHFSLSTFIFFSVVKITKFSLIS